MNEIIVKDWSDQLTWPILKLLDKPCSDCAVTCGLYLPYSRGLALESKEVQVAASIRWFCHNHPNRACRGNWNFLNL